MYDLGYVCLALLGLDIVRILYIYIYYGRFYSFLSFISVIF